MSDPRKKLRSGLDEVLTRHAATLLGALPDCTALAKRVQVRWHARLSSAAGRAMESRSLIQLNPRLTDFPGEEERTLRHELAHLVAFSRAAGLFRRKRIAPHGPEWRRACVELGLPDETRCHTLPFPRRQVTRAYAYRCPHCATMLRRVRPIPRRKMMACGTCCREHAGGRFDARFRLVAASPTVGQYPAAFSEKA